MLYSSTTYTNVKNSEFSDNTQLLSVVVFVVVFVLLPTKVDQTLHTLATRRPKNIFKLRLKLRLSKVEPNKPKTLKFIKFNSTIWRIV